MPSGDLISCEVDLKDCLGTLRRFDKDAEKVLRKQLTALGTDAKRMLVAKSPQKTGRMAGHWGKKTTINQKRIMVAATLNDWPRWDENTGRRLARYPFMLEHGRKGGVSKTGRVITPMTPRPMIAPTRVVINARAKVEAERIKREAVNAFGR
jgi:hypothetical protein